MSTFGSIDIVETGLDASQLWLDVISHNMANLNTIRPADEEPFRAMLLELTEGSTPLAEGGTGVEIVGLREIEGEPVRVQDPTHPFADEDGYVTMPVVDLAGHMADLIIASRQFQLNVRMLEANRAAYQSALRIGT
jgi:flagellar basal-body rod protein FlgC